VAINCASTLLILAQRAFARLVNRGVDIRVVIRVIDTVNSYYTSACEGQHLDLSLTPDDTFSEEVYLKIISMKSSSTVACACHTGALLANAKQELVDLFVSFGQNLGMASQIANDIRGITHGNDIVKRKITLPAIYALAHASGENRSTLEAEFYKRSVSSPEQIRELLFGSGAIQYSTVRMELYKQQALDCLIGAEHQGAKIDQLKPLLE
jgi:octaprenyl-diphosphate synthase